MRRSKIIALLLVVLLLAALILAQFYCPPEGCSLSAGKRALNRLKSRATLPEQKEFDRRVTLASLLQPGDDRTRWQETDAAVIEGFVIAVSEGGIEAANCFSPTRRDIHIEVALRPDAGPRERAILEVTPNGREWARGQGLDWSAATLKRELTGRLCRFEGWLLFDSQHAEESENTSPSGERNWRATAWELHPVTRLTVIR